MEKTRRQFTPQQKVAILREHLVEHVPVSDLCDKHKLHPTLFYQWQKAFFENGAAAFESRRPRSQSLSKEEDKIAALEAKLRNKTEVLAEVGPAPSSRFSGVAGQHNTSCRDRRAGAGWRGYPSRNPQRCNRLEGFNHGQ